MWPEMEMSCVPGLLGVPTFLNSSAPMRMIPVMLASDSTLLMTVGFWKRPRTVRRGGRFLG